MEELVGRDNDLVGTGERVACYKTAIQDKNAGLMYSRRNEIRLVLVNEESFSAYRTPKKSPEVPDETEKLQKRDQHN